MAGEQPEGRFEEDQDVAKQKIGNPKRIFFQECPQTRIQSSNQEERDSRAP